MFFSNKIFFTTEFLQRLNSHTRSSLAAAKLFLGLLVSRKNHAIPHIVPSLGSFVALFNLTTFTPTKNIMRCCYDLFWLIILPIANGKSLRIVWFIGCGMHLGDGLCYWNNYRWYNYSFACFKCFKIVSIIKLLIQSLCFICDFKYVFEIKVFNY